MDPRALHQPSPSSPGLSLTPNACPSQGEEGDTFFIVEYGRLGVFQKGGADKHQIVTTSLSQQGKSAALPPTSPPAILAHITTSAQNKGSLAKDQQPITTYQAGAYFGELSLIRNEPRAATVSRQDCNSIQIDHQDCNCIQIDHQPILLVLCLDFCSWYPTHLLINSS